jgi:DNA-binding beta-propeller fold protein YncE
MDRRAALYVVSLSAALAALAAALAMASPDRSPTPASPGRHPGMPEAVSLASFVNWETGHVHPMDMTPDGSRLLVCNTADARLMVFVLQPSGPFLVSEIPVGLEPISVRAFDNDTAWVVNNVSDSVSIVSLSGRNVVATLKTRDEPSDVVFAGTPRRAFVTCSQANAVQVFDPANLAAAPVDLPIAARDPRALAVSPDGQTVYAAIFNSGNGSTILGGGGTVGTLGFPPNVVSNPAGPYGGVNPPPNSGTSFVPAVNPAAGTPPPVGLIVKKNAAGQWMDDNGHNWTDRVSGANAPSSGRVVGWNIPDRDLAVINATTLSVTYATRLMNIGMGVGVNPATGAVTVIGTDATNEVRFEPRVNGTFVRVNMATVNPATLAKTIVDLNPHLTYAAPTVPQSERNKSIGDPRGITWNAAGTRGYITGMGSNNLIVVNAAGARAGLADTIPVGEGPTGIALDEARGRLYVLNRFAGTISVVSTASETVVGTVPFFDPTPAPIKVGRKHLYDTHKNSGLGQTSCASCHIDGRMDHLAWDLGDPSGTLKPLPPGSNLGQGLPGLSPPTANPPFQPWHPMKGPMTTQTLQDIIGKEPHHWRGDRFGIEEFNGAFMGLLGDDAQLTPAEMQQFEDFLATIAFPPNPYRNLDNSLPASLPLPGHYTPGRFAPAGLPLPPGNPNNGLTLYTSTTRRLDGGTFACVTCHTLPTGAGTDMTFSGFNYTQLPPGPMGERHLAMVSVDGSTNITIKTPQIRNAYFKVGFECTQPESLGGFGFLHDGSVDSIARFVAEPVFNVASDQEVADLVAFILCLSGSDLPAGAVNNPLSPPGVPSKDSHAAVGTQVTITSPTPTAPQLALIQSLTTMAQNGKIGLIVKAAIGGQPRGFTYMPATQLFQSDRAGQTFSPTALRDLAAPATPLTYTAVPIGTQVRMGIDRDEDGVLDGDVCYANCDGSATPPVLNVLDFSCFLNRFAANDPYANCDGSTTPPILNVLDFSCFLNRFAAGCP